MYTPFIIVAGTKIDNAKNKNIQITNGKIVDNGESTLAVTNAIVHGYDNGPGKVRMRLKGIQNQVIIEVHDDGLGMENVAKAMEPLYTTKPEQERSGMGFSFMEAFMDDLRVASPPIGWDG